MDKELAVHFTLSHYRIVAKIGAGGMGEVYLAEDTRLDRKVALKLYPSAFTEDEERVRHFEQEAQAASALSHPNIITVYGIGEWTGVPLSRGLDAVGLLPDVRFVSFYCFDDWADSIDLLDALHPQTLLAYGMNGRDPPVAHGAPCGCALKLNWATKT
jgi:DMSO/TMAO reductase YedYZ molybdopterin-dependent catalytic subunit